MKKLLLAACLLLSTIVSAQEYYNSIYSGTQMDSVLSGNFGSKSIHTTGNATVGGDFKSDSVLIKNSTNDNTIIGRGGTVRWANVYGDYCTFYGSQAGAKNRGGYALDFFGYNAGFENTYGVANVWFGYQAGHLNTLGSYNIGMGTDAGYNNDTSYNIYFGFHTGKLITTTNRITGMYNIWLGHEQAQYASTATRNTSMGYRAQYYLSTGRDNCSNGYLSNFSLTTGINNTSLGSESAFTSTTGNNNTSIGYRNLYSAQAGAYGNSSLGSYGMFSLTSGYANTGSGYNVGFSLTTGAYNTFMGYQSGDNALQKVDANYSIAIGYNTFTTANFQAVFGGDNITEIVLGQGHANIRSDSLMTHSEKSYLADSTGVITIATGVAGWGEVMAGNMEAFGQFRFTSAGIVTEIGAADNLNFSTTQHAYLKLCVYDAGSGIAIQNNLGSNLKVAVKIHYYTP